MQIIPALLTILITLVVIVGITRLYLMRPLFGGKPTGERLNRLKHSLNYKKGAFQNLSTTPMISPGFSYWNVFYKAIFKSDPRKRPLDNIPTVKTDLKAIVIDANVLVWFGHSSYFMQINGKRFLIDPVFSGNASPIPGTNKSFKGTDIYTADDMPSIDYLFITHDHYDHLDYKTIIKLKQKTEMVICGLGVGAHFEAWGFDKNKIIEKDWYDSVELDAGFKTFVTPARHFSGRGFSRNNTLWCSYVLQTPSIKIFMGGDSGYDTHYAAIGEKFGPFDLAILDNGQYNPAWHLIHELPSETLKAAKDLKAKRLLPVHSSKFALANHPWNEPLETITTLNEKNFHCPIITPKIGEVVNLSDNDQVFSKWWQEIK